MKINAMMIKAIMMTMQIVAIVALDIVVSRGGIREDQGTYWGVDIFVCAVVASSVGRWCGGHVWTGLLKKRIIFLYPYKVVVFILIIIIFTLASFSLNSHGWNRRHGYFLYLQFFSHLKQFETVFLSSSFFKKVQICYLLILNIFIKWNHFGNIIDKIIILATLYW